ncbi:protein SGT1-like [Scleropages formosus]|uniref:Protein SGT1-like n=1 Tax=Scleropages formosus TaxID=113540 RepID=A0A0P7X163_SCLFO|nr:protein SGT1-like [Scleropages formosus]
MPQEGHGGGIEAGSPPPHLAEGDVLGCSGTTRDFTEDRRKGGTAVQLQHHRGVSHLKAVRHRPPAVPGNHARLPAPHGLCLWSAAGSLLASGSRPHSLLSPGPRMAFVARTAPGLPGLGYWGESIHCITFMSVCLKIRDTHRQTKRAVAMDALRRPPVPDDVVHYQLFLVRSDPTEARDGEPELLQNLLEKILAEFAPLLVQYIWQHEPFNIKYHPLKGRVPAHIGGSTKFGDNVEDEWFIVYLLQQITRTFPQLAARYPGKIHSHLHRASCFVPAGIAAVLASRPDLLAPAVSAFYLRDPLDLQACRTFHTFPPDTCVMTSVVFTRCLYAQLQQQRFTPDCRSGFKLPAPSHPQYRSYDLGMKLAHGFEILCAKCRLPSSDKEAPVSCNPLWRGFMESLKKNDYFRGEMEGSARYRILMAQAEIFFKQSITTPHSWLDISPQELEHLLEEKAGWGADTSNLSKVDSAEGAKYDEASYNLVAVTRGVKNFINTISSHEGAELPWLYSDEPFSVDPALMASTLENLLGCQGAELDSDDLEDDDCDSDDDPTVRSVGQYPDLKEEAKEDALGTLKKYMDQMDLELKDTNIGKSFVKPESSEKSDIPKECQLHPGAVELQGEDEEIQPLDVDLNLVTNLLESLSSQEGLAGPASNLLQSMGFHVPQNSDQT